MAKQTKPLQNKPRLGRGLSSLIASSAEADRERPDYDAVAPEGPAALAREAGTTAPPPPQEVPIGDIQPNPFQPRREFANDDMDALAQSIAQQGVLQPLILSPAADPATERPYVLVAGERRLRAARQAGLTTVPCVVRQATHMQMLEWALVENIQRADLNPIERAEAYREYIDRFALTQAEAGERLGQPRATLANYLRLLDLCADAQSLLSAGHLSFGHGKVLAGLIDLPQRQGPVARRAAAEGMSVRELERLVAAERGRPVEPGARRDRAAKAAHLRDLEERLSRAVGTRVTIFRGRAKHTGRVVVEYYSLDDFDRIASALGLEDNG